MTVNPMSIGYGPRARLLFDGDENQYDLWEVRFLGYLQLQGLKSVVLSTEETIDADKNEKVLSEMVQVLDEKSLCLIMNDAADDGRMPCQQFQKVDFTCRIQQITCSFKK